MRSLTQLLAYGARLVLPLTAAGLVYAPAIAHAVPEFPREIKRDLMLDYEPPCSICHLKNNTGVGTAQTAFALALRERGLDAESRSSLGTALTQLDEDKLDSDGDGVSDVDELRAATDPNSDAPASLQAVQPQWGCAVYLRPDARRDVSSATLLPAAALVVGFLRRRRQRQ